MPNASTAVSTIFRSRVPSGSPAVTIPETLAAALADAATEFNRYNMKKLVVDPSAAAITIDGTFATDNLETFARVARIALGLTVQSNEREIIIKR